MTDQTHRARAEELLEISNRAGTPQATLFATQAMVHALLAQLDREPVVVHNHVAPAEDAPPPDMVDRMVASVNAALGHPPVKDEVAETADRLYRKLGAEVLDAFVNVQIHAKQWLALNRLLFALGVEGAVDVDR